MYKIEIVRAAEKELKHIFTTNKKLYNRLISAIDSIALNPNIVPTKKPIPNMIRVNNPPPTDATKPTSFNRSISISNPTKNNNNDIPNKDIISTKEFALTTPKTDNITPAMI